MTEVINERCENSREKANMWRKVQYNFIRSTAGY